MFKILIVEDDTELCQLFSHVLEKNGYHTRMVSNGQEALDALAEEYVELIISDIMMPVMNGIEAARNIRRKEKNGGKEIPIIAMTAQSERESKESCSLAGMNAYISKPVDPENLIRILRMYQKR